MLRFVWASSECDLLHSYFYQLAYPTSCRIFFLLLRVLSRWWCDIIKMFQRSVLSEADVTRLIIVTSVRSIYLSHLGWLVILSKWNLHLFLDPTLSRIIFFFLSDHKEIVTISLLMAKDDVWLNCSKVMIHLTLVDTR